jgi:hypothetical protein
MHRGDCLSPRALKFRSAGVGARDKGRKQESVLNHILPGHIRTVIGATILRPGDS